MADLTEFLKRRRVAEAHKIMIVEGGAEDPNNPDAEPMPGYFQVYCQCSGTRPIFRSYHGETLAKEAAERHIFSALHAVDLTPGGANRGPH